jgi:hypothetical protein
MRDDLWQALLRAWRRTFGFPRIPQEGHEAARQRISSRARFWAELREGQREAEERAGRRP